MTAIHTRFPRTCHAPWSRGAATPDDEHMAEATFMRHFSGQNVRLIGTEKCDGSNLSMTKDRVFSRSPTSRDRPSLHLAKQLWAVLRQDLPADTRIVGEWMLERHALLYEKLPSPRFPVTSSPFLVFAVIRGGTVIGWDDMLSFLEARFAMPICTVPVLWQGTVEGPYESVRDALHRACWRGDSCYGRTQEGYVLRVADSFDINRYHECVCKYVDAEFLPGNPDWGKGHMELNLYAE